MQDRMQSDSKLLGLAYTAVFGTLFPLFKLAARKFKDRERGFEISDQVMTAFMELRPKYLEAVKGNTAQVLGLKLHDPKVEEMARRVVRNHAYSWVDFFRFAQRPAQEAIDLFQPGVELSNLERVIREGKGGILLTAHAGNYELGGVLLRSKKISVHAVYKPDRFKAVERLRGDLREAGGVVGVPVDGVGFSTLPLVKVLREGKLVGMQGDRDFSLNGLKIPFFGREAYFPRGPWELAAMTGAPILCSLFYMDTGHRFSAFFAEPIYIRAGRGERMKEIEAGMRRYVSMLEDFIRKHPDQWYCFYPFWDDPMRVVGAEMGQPQAISA